MTTKEKVQAKPVALQQEGFQEFDKCTASRRSGPSLTTKEQVQAKRVAQQQESFQEFDKCPDCLGRRLRWIDRMYLFDAVVDCDTTLRIGTSFDGGKWLCNPERLRSSTVVYSFGVAAEISFDTEMATSFGAEVHMFDPSPQVARRYDALKSGKLCGAGSVFYHPLGLGPVSSVKGKEWSLTIEGQACPAKSLADIAKSLKHSHVDVLKIDIEGGELAALDQILADNSLSSLKVEQLLVEFHLWSDDEFKSFVAILEKLSKQGYRLFRKEFNPHDATHCAEFSFVRV